MCRNDMLRSGFRDVIEAAHFDLEDLVAMGDHHFVISQHFDPSIAPVSAAP